MVAHVCLCVADLIANQPRNLSAAQKSLTLSLSLLLSLALFKIFDAIESHFRLTYQAATDKCPCVHAVLKRCS